MILVTGGTGLVGSHLLLALSRQNLQVRAIHRPGSDLQKVRHIFFYYCEKEEAERLFSRIEWIVADITDIPQLTPAFELVTEVYHCAAMVSFNPSDEKALRKINIEGTANIVNLSIARGVSKLCYVSSIASLGKPVNPLETVDEHTLWNPENNNSDYAISKYGAEIEVWRASQEGVKVVIINPGVIIGPGFWKNGSGQIFTRINNGLNYHFPKITGFIGVWDVARIMILLMASQVYNQKYVLVAENLSFRQVFEEISTSIGKPKPVKALKKWMITTAWVFQKFGSFFGMPRSISRRDISGIYEKTYYDSSKIRKELNFEFTPVKEVILETGSFYIKDEHL